MKVLVVDDEQIVLNSCKRVLEADGFEVLLATSAHKAITALEEEGFSFLLIDVKMPLHDGMWLMADVRKRWPYMPIIAMSAYHPPETIEEAVRMGASTFIAKPFTPDELREAVRLAVRDELDR